MLNQRKIFKNGSFNLLYGMKGFAGEESPSETVQKETMQQSL